MMVMVVAYPILEARRRPGWLNAPDQTLSNQDGQRVVDRLERDGPDFGPDRLGHYLRRDVG